jgi:hypothetical protein
MIAKRPKPRLIDRSQLAIQDVGASRERPNAWFRSPDHLAWIRKQPCPFCTVQSTEWPIEACHVRFRTDGGTGVKPSDLFTWSGCARHHHEQHFIGEPAFFSKHNIQDPAMWAVKKYALESPCPLTRQAAGRWMETGRVMP